MIYAFDLDQTLCSNEGNYLVSKPLLKRIEAVNKLYNDGHEIIIYTARGMKSNNGNVKLCYEQYYYLTKEQLDSWGVKYHKIVLGKPTYDLLVDDKAINDKNFFKD